MASSPFHIRKCAFLDYWKLLLITVLRDTSPLLCPLTTQLLLGFLACLLGFAQVPQFETVLGYFCHNYQLFFLSEKPRSLLISFVSYQNQLRYFHSKQRKRSFLLTIILIIHFKSSHQKCASLIITNSNFISNHNDLNFGIRVLYQEK